MQFYDDIAEYYDELVAGETRVSRAQQLARQLQHRGVLSAVDTACGTGLHAIELANCGINVNACDISGEMIRRAQLNAQASEAKKLISFHSIAMQQLDQSDLPAADAVVCIGNSIVHLLTDDELRDALSNFYKLCNPGGTLVIHLLNYQRILEQKQRFVGATRNGDNEYIRFYDFLGDDLVRFNILHLQWTGDKCQHTLHQSKLRPLTPTQLETEIKNAGFSSVQLSASLDGEAFDAAESGSLYIWAKRN